MHPSSPSRSSNEPVAPDRPVGPEAVPPRWVVLAALAAMAVLIALARLQCFHEPLERDIITYMLVGTTITHGGECYYDAWEIKPPGTYFLYMLAEMAVGYGERQIYLLNVGTAVTTLLGVYLCGSIRGRAAGLWGAGFWVWLSGAQTLQANQPNTEVFLNSCTAWAFALLLWIDKTRGLRRIATALAVGACFAAGSFTKQIEVVDAIFLSFAHVLLAGERSGGRRRALLDVALIAAVGAVAWFGLLAYALAAGRFELYWITLFVTPKAYSGSPLFNLYRYFREGRVLPPFLRFCVPVAILVVIGAWRDRGSEYRRIWGLYFAAVVAIQLKIAFVGTGFFPHYYQFWLPILAVGAGWAAARDRAKPPTAASTTTRFAVLATFVFLSINQGYYLTLSSEETARIKYGLNTIESRDLGEKLSRLLRPDERLYQHGDNPTLYYYSGRRSPTTLLWAVELNDSWPIGPFLVERTLEQLAHDPPDLVVVEPDKPGAHAIRTPGLVARLLGGSPRIDTGKNSKKILDALLPSYRPLDLEELRPYTQYLFYVRKGSELDRRLEGSHAEVDGASPGRRPLSLSQSAGRFSDSPRVSPPRPAAVPAPANLAARGGRRRANRPTALPRASTHARPDSEVILDAPPERS